MNIFVVDSYRTARLMSTMKTVGCCPLDSQLAVTLKFLQLTLRFVGGGTASKKIRKTHKYTNNCTTVHHTPEQTAGPVSDTYK